MVMRKTIANIFWLGTKELRAFQPRLCAGRPGRLGVFVLDCQRGEERRSRTCTMPRSDHRRGPFRSCRAAFPGRSFPPIFNPPQLIGERDIDALMNDGKMTFAIDIPPNFQRDLLGGRQPAIQVNIDATAMMQAGIGAGYIYQIISTEIARSLTRNDTPSVSLVDLQVRIAFNPNLTAAWFTGLMEVVNNVTMLALILGRRSHYS